MVKIIDDLPDDPKYQLDLLRYDFYFLRDPKQFSILNVWIKQGEICIVVDQDFFGVVVLTPRGHIGWIGKEKMEILK